MSNDASVDTEPKQNMLFGILALQAEYIDLPTLVGAVNTWVLDTARPLSQILREQDKLTVAQGLMIEALVEERLHRTQPDNGSFASLPSAVCPLPAEASTASVANGVHRSPVARG